MKMYYYRDKVPNFGDELNTWLLPKVLPNFFDEDENTLFLGIGSILFNTFPRKSRKIVFGSGYGGYTDKPELDDMWKIYCVRGPRTAAAFNLPKEKVAGDSAILIARHFKRSSAKRSGFAFMPHYKSLERGNWALACEMAGIRFIDPRKPVEQVLAEIDRSEAVITEAMHGAIVSDAIRVPWIPVYPFDRVHHMKWLDWADALDLKLQRKVVLPSSFTEAALLIYPHVRRLRPVWRILASAKGGAPANPSRAVDAPEIETTASGEKGEKGVNQIFVRAAAASLKRATLQPVMLSSDAALERVIDKLETQANKIRQDFANGALYQSA
jgi:succinoglycan biosynthesis protein ExoV